MIIFIPRTLTLCLISGWEHGQLQLGSAQTVPGQPGQVWHAADGREPALREHTQPEQNEPWGLRWVLRGGGPDHQPNLGELRPSKLKTWNLGKDRVVGLKKLGLEFPLPRCNLMSWNWWVHFPLFAKVNKNFNAKFETHESSDLVICLFLLWDNFSQLANSKYFWCI